MTTAPASVSPRPTGFVGTRTVYVEAATTAQAMLDARPGDVLIAPAGSILPPLTVPPRQEGDWITLMTSAEASLPRPGRVVQPSDVNPMVMTPSISAGPGTGGWRFVGVEVARKLVPETVYQLVYLQDSERLAFERCYIHGAEGLPTRRGVMLNARDVSIVDTLVDTIFEDGADSQAICGWDGTARVLIENCDLEAATENVMFGGSDSASAQRVPSDITIKGCRLWKLARRPVQKNLLELKSARRVSITDCTLWGFAGVAFVLTPRNQGGAAPWSCVEDVLIEDIRLRGGASIFSLLTTDNDHASGLAQRITVQNVLALDITDWAFMLTGAASAEDLTVRHVTCLPTRKAPFWLETACHRLTLTDNIFGAGSYAGQPVEALHARASESTIERNLLVNAGDLDGAGPDRNRGFPPVEFMSLNPADVPIDTGTGVLPAESIYHAFGYQEEVAMATLEERLAALEQGGAALSGQAAALEPRIATLETGIDTRLSAVEATYTDLGARLMAMEARVAALEAAH